MLMMVLPFNHTLRIKQCHIPKDIPGISQARTHRSKKSRGVHWLPLTYSGPQDAWNEKRNHLAATESKHRNSKAMTKLEEQAEEPLQSPDDREHRI